MNLLFANDRRGSYPPSWYAASAAPLPACPPLRGSHKADVAIVGAGYTGLSAALHLAQRGLSVRVLEAHRMGFGASGRNGGQVGTGFNKPQSWLEKRMGPGPARQLWDLAQEAKDLTRSLVAAHAPEAAWHDGVLHACWHGAEVRAAHDEASHLFEAYGYDQITPLDRDACQDIVHAPGYQGGTLDMGAGHLHPLRYALGLARAAQAAGAELHEGSHVHHVQPGPAPVVQTDAGRVEARHVILACNGYIGGLERKSSARVMPINNFIAATAPLGPRAAEVLSRNVAVADSRFVINYFRLSEDGRLLFGGGESYGYRFPHDIPAKVRPALEEVFPQLAGVELTHGWGGTLGITASRLPVFMRPAQGLLTAGGFSGHGVALAGLAGKVLAEAVAGQEGRFDVLSALPTPAFPGGAALRSPLLKLAMSWYVLRDKLGL